MTGFAGPLFSLNRIGTWQVGEAGSFATASVFTITAGMTSFPKSKKFRGIAMVFAIASGQARSITSITLNGVAMNIAQSTNGQTVVVGVAHALIPEGLLSAPIVVTMSGITSALYYQIYYTDGFDLQNAGQDLQIETNNNANSLTVNAAIPSDGITFFAFGQLRGSPPFAVSFNQPEVLAFPQISGIVSALDGGIWDNKNRNLGGGVLLAATQATLAGGATGILRFICVTFRRGKGVAP